MEENEDFNMYFYGKSLVHVRSKDGVRIYYDENKNIHRDPARGPAIEYSDGTGPCYVHGSPNGEKYENYKYERPSDSELNAVLADKSDDLFTEKVPVEKPRISIAQHLMKIAQASNSFTTSLSSKKSDNTSVTIKRKGKTMLLDNTKKPALDLRGIAYQPVPQEQPAEKLPLSSVADMLRKKFRPVQRISKDDNTLK